MSNQCLLIEVDKLKHRRCVVQCVTKNNHYCSVAFCRGENATLSQLARIECFMDAYVAVAVISRVVHASIFHDPTQHKPM